MRVVAVASAPGNCSMGYNQGWQGPWTNYRETPKKQDVPLTNSDVPDSFIASSMRIRYAVRSFRVRPWKLVLRLIRLHFLTQPPPQGDSTIAHVLSKIS